LDFSSVGLLPVCSSVGIFVALAVAVPSRAEYLFIVNKEFGPADFNGLDFVSDLDFLLISHSFGLLKDNGEGFFATESYQFEAVCVPKSHLELSMIDLLYELELLVVVLSPDLASCDIDVFVMLIDQYFFFEAQPVVDMQLAGIDSLPGVLEHIKSAFDSEGADFTGEGLKVAGVGEVLKVQGGDVRAVGADVVEFVEGGHNGAEVQHALLE
jgi:hypothetical protein